jgi:hypothetical protein
MADLGYSEACAVNSIEARLRLVPAHHETGSIRQTARRWHTSRRICSLREVRMAGVHTPWSIPV